MSEQAPDGRSGPTHEVRLAVVMYGGISLAIYIHGVAQELLHVTRGTSAAPDEVLTPLEHVYRRIGRQLGPEGAWHGEPRAGGGVRTAVVIDVLSGTSAGGINAIALAKALATGATIAPFGPLWIDEGDIETLIDDGEEGEPPVALLRGDHMFRVLRRAFDQMDDDGARAAGGAAERHEPAREVDLFVTATDLAGLATPLRLADGVQTELRHRNVFHLRHARDGAGAHDDFARANNPFLAFAARATSSIPLAFRPVDLEGILARSPNPEDAEGAYERWKRFFPDYGRDGADVVARPFVDGGVLDNKPFGHAIGYLTSRSGATSVERKLLYVEPRPEDGDGLRPIRERHFTAQDSLLAGIVLPGYETIRDDLERVLARNRLIERVATLTLGAEEDLEREAHRGASGAAQHLPTASETQGTFLAEHIARTGLGPTFGGYHRLKVATVTDDLADVVAAAAGVGEHADERRAIRRLVGAWRYREYDRASAAGGKEPEAAFLYRFDLGHHLRRLDFVLEQIDAWTAVADVDALPHGKRLAFRRMAGRPVAAADLHTLQADLRALRPALHAERAGLHALRERLQEASRLAAATPSTAPPRPDDDLHRVLRAVRGWAASDAGRIARAEALEQLDVRSAAFELSDPTALTQLALALERLGALVLAEKTRRREAFRRVMEAARPSLGATVALDSFDGFERFDLIRFPVLRTADVGDELSRVDVHRISPVDATAIVDERAAEPGERATYAKLAGTMLGSFGAFFERRWREDDNLWGRLDGAERLVTSLVADRRAQIELIADLHVEIIAETYTYADGAYERRATSASRTDARMKKQADAFAELRLACERDPDLRARLSAVLAEAESALEGWLARTTRSPVHARAALQAIGDALRPTSYTPFGASVVGALTPASSALERLLTAPIVDVGRAHQVVRHVATLTHSLRTVVGDRREPGAPPWLYAAFVYSRSVPDEREVSRALLARVAPRAIRRTGRILQAVHSRSRWRWLAVVVALAARAWWWLHASWSAVRRWWARSEGR
ncbi:hypothetical protein BH23DEI1_BH23DEI1_14650 [soil metagenome]